MKRQVMPKMFLAGAICLLGEVLGGVSSQGAPDPGFALHRTKAAPVVASGVARFGKQKSKTILSITTLGMEPGTYQVSAVRKSDQTALSLGVFVVSNPAAFPDRTAGGDQKEPPSGGVAEQLQTKTTIPLPAQLGRADIAEIKVSTTGGVALLSGKTPQARH